MSTSWPHIASAEDAFIADLLASYVDRLVIGDDHDQDFLALYPELRQQTMPLFRLARDLSAWLRPVAPRPAFRRDLRQALIASASQRLPMTPFYSASQPDHRREWVWGAAAVSVVGVLAYLWRRNSGTAPNLPVH